MESTIFISMSHDELAELIKKSVSEAFINKGITSQKNDSKLLNVKEAADFMDLATQTLYGYTSKRLIPFVKRGKKLYFQKEELEKWLLEGKKLTKAEIEAGISLHNKKGAKGYGK